VIALIRVLKLVLQNANEIESRRFPIQLFPDLSQESLLGAFSGGYCSARRGPKIIPELPLKKHETVACEDAGRATGDGSVHEIILPANIFQD
jgi:hypothetical protein